LVPARGIASRGKVQAGGTKMQSRIVGPHDRGTPYSRILGISLKLKLGTGIGRCIVEFDRMQSKFFTWKGVHEECLSTTGQTQNSGEQKKARGGKLQETACVAWHPKNKLALYFCRPIGVLVMYRRSDVNEYEKKLREAESEESCLVQLFERF